MSHKNIKRVVAQKMMTHQTSNGKVKNMINVISAVKSNSGTQIIRHVRENNNRSTILAKSNGKKFSVIEKHGNNQPIRLENQSINKVKKMLKNQKSKMLNNNTRKGTKRKLSIKSKINNNMMNQTNQEQQPKKKRKTLKQKPKSASKAKKPKSASKAKKPKSASKAKKPKKRVTSNK